MGKLKALLLLVNKCSKVHNYFQNNAQIVVPDSQEYALFSNYSKANHPLFLT